MISSNVICRELIGRSLELDHLLKRLPPGSGRASAVVVLRGEAGVGKTRLTQAFAQSAAQRGARVVACGVREYANAPYAPIVEAIELLGARASFAETDAQAPGGDGKMRRFSAVAAQLSALVAGDPHATVVIIEDLQWADGGTIEALRFLGHRLVEDPVLFVATYRTDEIEADSARARALAALERDAGETIGLEPLRDDEIERLIRSILRDSQTQLPALLLADVRDLADGRPLFAEELLRGVFERIARDGTARAGVPTSIRATVRERFGELAAGDRDVVLHAAVIGKRFSAAFLTRLLQAEPAVVLRALRRARDLQLIVEENDAEGNAFAFRHALTREAVYGELLRAEARELHARVAVALASESPLDIAAIAEHAYRARDAERALTWNERAGDAALAVYAYGDAARHYERAHEFAVQPAQRAALARKAADGLYAAGLLEQAATWLSHALTDCRTTGDTALVLQLATQRARVLWESGRREEGIDEVRAFAAQLPADAPGLRFETATVLGSLLNASGRAAEALEHLQIAQTLIAHGEHHVVTRFHGVYGFTLALVGRATEAREPLSVAVERARAAGDDDVLLRTLNNYGNVELTAGTVATARARYEDALVVAERTKNLRTIAWISQNAAVAALVAGDLETAERHLARSRSIDHDVPLVHRFRTALDLRRLTLLGAARENERREAASAFDEALRAGDEQAISVLGAALAHDRMHDGDDARAIVHDALAAVTRVDAPFWLIGVTARLGEAADRARARELAAANAVADDAWGPHGLVSLCDAREALRRRRRDEAVTLAGTAAAQFHRAGWVLEQAEAFELAGRVAEAVALVRRIGAAAEVRRLTETGAAPARRRGEATLTAREREIVSLVLAGRTAREIADALVISDRTVETHVASVYRKLGVSNRHELSALVDRTSVEPSLVRAAPHS